MEEVVKFLTQLIVFSIFIIQWDAVLDHSNYDGHSLNIMGRFDF